MRELENFNIGEEATEHTKEQASVERRQKRRERKLVFPKDLEEKLPLGTDTPCGVCRVDNAIINIAVAADTEACEVTGYQAEILQENMKIGQENRILKVTAEMENPEGYVLIKCRRNWLAFNWDGNCDVLDPEKGDKWLMIDHQRNFVNTVAARKTA